MNNYKYVKCYD